MKVGIVTITDNSNYGNRLQNYAMFYIMKRKLGYKTVSLVSYSDNPLLKRRYGNYLKTRVIRLLSSVCPRYAGARFGVETLRWNNFANGIEIYLQRIIMGVKNFRQLLIESLITL